MKRAPSRVVLRATHAATLRVVKLADLRHALDVWTASFRERGAISEQGSVYLSRTRRRL
jgi:hypothetical protein